MPLSAVVDSGEHVPYVHPGPSDELLSASTAGCQHASVAAVSAAAAAAAEEGDSSTAQEDRDLAQAMAASLADSAPTPAAAATAKASSAEGQEQRDRREEESPLFPPDEEFFWVEAEWLRQWVVGQHAELSVAKGAGAAAAAFTVPNGGTLSSGPVVLDIVDSPLPKGKVDTAAGDGGGGGTDAVANKTDEDEPAVAAAAARGDGKSDVKGETSGTSGGGGGDEERPVLRSAAAAGVADASLNGTPKQLKVEGSAKRSLRSQEKGGDQAGGVVIGDGNTAAELSNGVDNAAAEKVGGGASRTTPDEQIVKLSRGDADAVLTPPRCVFAQRMRNGPLLCPHGGLHPSTVSRLKLVTREVYEGMLGVKDGAGALALAPDRHIAAGNYYCAICVKDHVQQKWVLAWW